MKKIYQYILLAVAMVATASCSNELDDTLQPVENGNLQFVVGDFPAFGEDPQTRASSFGTPDEGKTAWANEDKILVHLYSQKYGDQAVTLTFDAENNTWESDGGTLSYLENETPTITAVYAPDCEIKEGQIALQDGKQYGEAEYILARTTISENSLDINFESGRTYSRLRIVAEAEQTLTVTTTGFTPAGLENVSAPDSYTLVADGKDNAYLYGTFAEGGSVTVKKGDAELATHTFSVTSEQGKSYALYAGKKVDVDLSTLAATYVINDDAYYTFTGTGSYGIKVESGNPTIILNNVSITVGKEWDNENIVNAIDIVADNSETTVWITGTNNLTSNSGAGIYVKSGSTVIIKSDSRDNILTARAGMDGAGIGGTGYDFSYENVTCGNIYIENITVNAYSSGYMSSNPGIGAITSCGTITIKNATVTALGSNQGGVLYGGEFCPAIGASTVPDIVIENSTIDAYRGESKDGGTGSLADWIGAVIIYDPYSGDTPHTPGIQCGNGYIISTTVNKFLYKASSGVTKEEGSVTYDADGNPTEQTAE
jgi:hypothetical protein